MGCNTSKQVQITDASTNEFKVVRGDLYVAWPSGPCRAVLMTCAALGVKPNLKPLDLFKGETKTPEFIAINPFHTVPTYVDGDFKLWESRAIMTYFVATFGGPDHALYPRDPMKRAMVDNVLNVDQSSFAKSVTAWAIPQFSGNKDGVDLNEKLEEVKKGFRTLDEFYLKNHQFVAGNQMTVADLGVLATVTFTEVFDMDLSEFPNIVAWRSRMKKLPYFEKCNKGLYNLKKSLQERNSN